jgi:hypothetical protein
MSKNSDSSQMYRTSILYIILFIAFIAYVGYGPVMDVYEGKLDAPSFILSLVIILLLIIVVRNLTIRVVLLPDRKLEFSMLMGNKVATINSLQRIALRSFSIFVSIDHDEGKARILYEGERTKQFVWALKEMNEKIELKGF